jgi:hypothetical protein
MTIEEALGTLIRMANPYTDGSKGTIRPDVPQSPRTEITGGDEDIDLSQIRVEEDNYGQAWTFRGGTQTIKKGLRITYRYPKKDRSGSILYYVTEHLLVGYAGGDGP